MRPAVRWLLAWFAFFGLTVGAWQQLAPRSFYDDFPGLGRAWVSPDGPYNEHLLRDVGGGNLALGTVALVALLTGGVWLARATGLGAIVANLPHNLYHQVNVDVLPEAGDRWAQSLTLFAVSAAALALTFLAFRAPASAGAPAVPGRSR